MKTISFPGLFFFIACALIPTSSTLASPLSESLSERVSFDLGDIDARSSDGAAYNLIDPLTQFTGGVFHEAGSFLGHEGGSSIEVTLLGHVAGYTDYFGYLDSSGSFNSIIGSNENLGTTQTVTQGASDLFTFAGKTPHNIFSSIDSDNPHNDTQLLASIVTSAGLLEIPFATIAGESLAFQLQIGDVIFWLEDLALSERRSDRDYNDLLVIVRQTEINKPIYAISGVVYYSDGATPLADALVTLGSASVTTTANGQYSFSGLRAGNHSVVSAKPGFFFADNPRAVTIASSSVSNVDFIAVTEPPYIISGTVRDSSGAVVPGAKIAVDGVESAISDGLGIYNISAVARGSYQITASFPDSVVTPDGFSNPVVVLDRDISSIDFLVSCFDEYTFNGSSCAADQHPIVVTASDDTHATHIAVNWNQIVHAEQYLLYRSLSNGVLGDIIATTTGDHFDDFSAAAGIIYYYTIIAQKAGVDFVTSNTDPGRRLAVVADLPCSDQSAVRDDSGECVLPDLPKEELRSPVYTKYNTFLSQWNFLELIARGTKAIDATITVFKIDGSIIKKFSVTIAPQQQIDIDIHGIVGAIDTYGLVKIEFDNSQDDTSLLGRMTMYRKNPGQDDYSFAFARELSNPIRGTSFASANSYDPQGQGYLVPNWMEITNLTDAARSFTHRVYDQAGKLVQEKSFVIAPFGQFDVNAGHEFGEGVYLNEVVAHNTQAPYLAAVSRYSSNSFGGAEAETYNFAFSLQAQPGSEKNQYLAITNDVGACWSQTNWIEVVNVLNKSADATIIFRDAEGKEIAKDSITLDARSQFHFNASALLNKATRGSVAVKSSTPSALLVQGLVYYHDCKSNLVQTAYASPGKRPQGALQVGSLNTNLEMRNVLSLIPVAKNTFDTTIRVKTSTSTEEIAITTAGGFSVEEVSFDATGALPIAANRYGTLAVETPLEQQVVAEALRIRDRADGGVDFVIPTMLK